MWIEDDVSVAFNFRAMPRWFDITTVVREVMKGTNVDYVRCSWFDLDGGRHVDVSIIVGDCVLDA
tara:strand:+ start:404 stop:598 length:195 start_codon:yes stop_codon:yes gene_type:complete